MPVEYLLLCASAFAGGVVNSVAGGGTLLTFPILLSVLGPSLGSSAAVVANGTSTVALLPGSLAAAWGYRAELAGTRPWLNLLIPPSLIGAFLGTLLVIWQPKLFADLVPWLILIAALLFALQPAIARWTGIGKPHGAPSGSLAVGIVGFQFLVAVYGGYFGAGIGILMLSALAMMGLADIHRMNALKTLLASCINAVSVAVFVYSDTVYWPFAWMMAASAIAGGYCGARVAQRLDRNLVRRTVVAIGLGLAAYYFYRQLGSG
jgi:uncharacterized membrane protein YfcA